MKTVELEGFKRDQQGKKGAKDLRKEGKIPAVMYGAAENLNLYVDEVALGKIINSPDIYLINLKVGDETTRVIIQDMQFHPVSDRALHVDFLEAAVGKVAKLHLPVHITGNSVGVLAGGKLVVKMRKLKVQGIPADLPDKIEVDISDLAIGKAIKVQDLDGFDFLDAPNTVIVRVKTARAEIVEVVEEVEGEEGEEGVEGAAEGAEAPAAEGGDAPAAEAEKTESAEA